LRRSARQAFDKNGRKKRQRFGAAAVALQHRLRYRARGNGDRIMPAKEDWREFYTQAGFRHGFGFGAQAVLDAAAPYLKPDQRRALMAWLAKDVKAWRDSYLSNDEPPRPPKL
jgi:hypothetical protein